MATIKLIVNQDIRKIDTKIIKSSKSYIIENASLITSIQ